MRACQSLDASGIPDSLDHGDLAADEVIIGAMGPVFLDWSDGSITHPFLSAASLLSGGGVTRADADELAAAYLGPWLSAGLGLTMETGRDALELARTVLPLHRVALYVGARPAGHRRPGRIGGGRATHPAGYPAGVTRQRIPDAVLAAAHERSRARAAQDWAEADRLRAEIESAGWKIADRGIDFALTPVAAADIADGERVRYGSSASVPSVLGDPPTGLATVVLIATDWPDDLARAIAGLARQLAGRDVDRGRRRCAIGRAGGRARGARSARAVGQPSRGSHLDERAAGPRRGAQHRPAAGARSGRRSSSTQASSRPAIS